MKIEKGSVLKLSDNNEYLVFNHVIHEKKTYVFIVDIKNPQIIKICFLNDNKKSLSESTDTEINKKLLALFAENLLTINDSFNFNMTVN